LNIQSLKIAYHPVYVHPLPQGHRFPMLKYELIPEQLLYEGVITPGNLLAPDLVMRETILLTHQQNYWDRLQNLELSAAEERRIGFQLSARLLEREMRIAQGTIETSLSALKNGLGFNVAGGTHHAGSNWGEGFCLLNDQAIAANYLLREKLVSRILIVDLDVHQGNGTADIFRNQPKVFTFSMHGQKNFPFRKEISDLDIGLEEGIGDREYLDILQTNLDQVFNNFRPDFAFYLAGADVLETDKLGKLALSTQGCLERDEIVFNLCKNHLVPVQVSMGGGYSPGINDIVKAHCNTFKAGIRAFF
jgi:acetoin utilization deacetylase AcuC-like enzyme